MVRGNGSRFNWGWKGKPGRGWRGKLQEPQAQPSEKTGQGTVAEEMRCGAGNRLRWPDSTANESGFPCAFSFQSFLRTRVWAGNANQPPSYCETLAHPEPQPATCKMG